MDKVLTFFLLFILCGAQAISDGNSKTEDGPTVTFVNDSDIPINFQVWTSGKVFIVTVCNTYPGSSCHVGVGCVWYDLYAISMNNTVIGDVKGAYCGGTYCVLGSGDTYVMGECHS